MKPTACLLNWAVIFLKFLETEPDPGLANGGLGNVATSYIDSLTTLGCPGFGYGILYEYGLFRQAIVDGRQVEQPDNWLAHRSPWLIARPGETVDIGIGGTAEYVRDEAGRLQAQWTPAYHIAGKPHDMPIVGWGGENVHYLRLFQAQAGDDAFDIRIFNDGDYISAVERQVHIETVSRVLYPNDEPEEGQRLRLIQEYFLVGCSLQDVMVRIEDAQLPELPNYVAVHLNDTHPALAVLELMRILVDERQVDWDQAWALTRECCFYTNHTLLPEALERWPMPLFAAVLPRHQQIVLEINHRFIQDECARWKPMARA